MDEKVSSVVLTTINIKNTNPWTVYVVEGLCPTGLAWEPE
jgi:hypothetical protein